MKVVEVDSKTGVPLHPEDILSDSGPVSGKINGVPKRFLLGGLMITCLFPLIGFVFGYWIYRGVVDALVLATSIFIFDYLTIRVIAWMTKVQNS